MQLKLCCTRLKVEVIASADGSDAASVAQDTATATPACARRIIVTKLDGTSKGGMVVAIQKELGLRIKFICLGEQPDDLQPFDGKQFAQALFEK